MKLILLLLLGNCLFLILQLLWRLLFLLLELLWRFLNYNFLRDLRFLNYTCFYWFLLFSSWSLSGFLTFLHSFIAFFLLSPFDRLFDWLFCRTTFFYRYILLLFLLQDYFRQLFRFLLGFVLFVLFRFFILL